MRIRGIQIYKRCSIIRGVLIQVHARDRYERFMGVFACMGPGDGPVRALGGQLSDDFPHSLKTNNYSTTSSMRA